MRVSKVNPSFLVFAGLILTVGNAAGQQSKQAKSAGDWPTYGLNSHETRYSPLNQINAGNVSRLGLAWSYDIGAGGGNQEEDNKRRADASDERTNAESHILLRTFTFAVRDP